GKGDSFGIARKAHIAEVGVGWNDDLYFISVGDRSQCDGNDIAASLLPAICLGVNASSGDSMNRLCGLCNRRHATSIKQRYRKMVGRHYHRRRWRGIQDVYNNLGRREIA